MMSLKVALIGNPNVGKTTVFNQLTGARQRVGNWSGVTVDRHEGVFNTATQRVTLIDLPGTLTLITPSYERSLDEQIACRYLLSGDADLLINVVDAANLERSLPLTLEILALGVPCIVALTMLDVARNQQIDIDIAQLSSQLGCPVVALQPTSKESINALKSFINKDIEVPDAPRLKLPASLQLATQQFSAQLSNAISARQRLWLAQQLLCGDVSTLSLAGITLADVQEKQHEMAAHLDQDVALTLASARRHKVTEICQACCGAHAAIAHPLTGVIDSIVLNRWLGVPVFLLVMYLMFFMAINLGGALQPLFDIGSIALFVHGLQWLGAWAHFPDWLTLFLAQGIGGGINTVLPLVPQIGMMYLFLSLLEDSGYMARAAFVIDRLMQWLGLPGKSFVPLIVGFGCNVPAIMGTRTLDTLRDRQMTIVMAPFMSCGARLAIFAVFAAAFFGQQSALLVFSLYLLGIVAAVFTGLVLKKTVMRGDAHPFIMELPVYHVPHVKTLLLQTWLRLKGFVLRAGKVIVIASIVIGGLNSFSITGKPVDSLQDSALATISRHITPLLHPMGVKEDNWQATVGLMTGALAKEVVVGTLNTLYTAEALQAAPFDAEQFSLLGELHHALTETGQAVQSLFSWRVLMNPLEASKGDGDMNNRAMGAMQEKFGDALAAYSYLIFVLLYVPCVSVMGAIARESGRGWMTFSIFWGLNIAGSCSILFYQLATFAQHPLYSAQCLMSVLVVNVLLIMGMRWAGHGARTHAAVPVVVNATPGKRCKGCSGSGCH